MVKKAGRDFEAEDWSPVNLGANGSEVWMTDVERLNADLQSALNQLAEVSAAARNMAARCAYWMFGIPCDPECRGQAICGREGN